MQKPTLPYRPEIDGLRAVAVLSVLIYHADFLIYAQNPIPGGYLGVDIFFVISGYLISSIIIKDMDGPGFSFAKFYERRARRILPILLTVMLVCTPMAWIFLIPESMREYCYSIITSLIFSSNFYFWSEDPYWSTGGDVRPFLHTWSLAVEEQFYLVMPLIFLVIIRINKNLHLSLIFILALVSLVFAQWASSALQEFAFYLLPARIWELLAGTAMAVLERQRGRATLEDTSKPPLIQHLPTMGFFLVVFPMFMFSSETQHPSAFTLVPVIGTMLIIWFSNMKDLSIKILSSKPFVAVGLISYGVYMWHFPIFSFGKFLFREQGNSAALILTLASILFASISFFLIERPARNRSLISTRNFIRVTGTATLLIASFSAIGMINGYAFRFPAFLSEQARPEKLENHKWKHPGIGSVQAGRIILAGDSHMQVLAPELQKTALNNGFAFAVSNYAGCQLISGTNRVNSDGVSFSKRCISSLQETRLSFIEGSIPSYVVLGGRLPLILEELRFDNLEGGIEIDKIFFIQNDSNTLATKSDRNTFIKRQYQATVDRIIQAGHRVILIYPIPEVGWSVPEKLAERVMGASGDAREIAASDPVTTSAAVFAARTARAYDLLDNINGRGIFRIYPEQIFCDTTTAGRCITHNLDYVYYRDDDHLSDTGAKLLAKLIMNEITEAKMER